MRKKELVLSIIVLILIFNNNNPIQVTEGKIENKTQASSISLIPHEEIVISSDGDFITYGFSRSGTENDPYLIEDLEIIEDQSTGIKISGTTKHFVIRNCVVKSSTTCIQIQNVANDTVRLEENYISYDVFGQFESLYLINSHGAKVVNNTMLVGGNGVIRAVNSEYLKISRNNISYGGNCIDLLNCDNSEISENLLGYSSSAVIDIYESDNVLIENNEIYGSDRSGISIERSLDLIIQGNIIKGSEKEENRGIYLINVVNALVTDNVCTKLSTGIYVAIYITEIEFP